MIHFKVQWQLRFLFTVCFCVRSFGSTCNLFVVVARLFCLFRLIVFFFILFHSNIIRTSFVSRTNKNVNIFAICSFQANTTHTKKEMDNDFRSWWCTICTKLHFSVHIPSDFASQLYGFWSMLWTNRWTHRKLHRTSQPYGFHRMPSNLFAL